MQIESRFYQQIAMAEVRTAFAKGAKAVVLVAPTGSGKGVMLSLIAQAAAVKGTGTCILVHRNNLLYQASQSLRDCGIPHGVIGRGRNGNSERIQVATVQTLVHRLNHHRFKLLIPDECHHAIADTWQKVMGAMPDAWVLGTTATPVGAGGRGLNGVFDVMVKGPSTKDLIEQGYLVQPVVYGSRKRLDLSRVHTCRGDYDQNELEAIVDRQVITGSAVEHYTRLSPGEPAVVFTVSIKHAHDVAQEFRDAGYNFRAVSGKMKAEEVQAILADMRGGRLQGIASCDLVSEGTDIPCLRTGILLRPTKSEVKYIQQVGRLLRVFAGKTRALILDHAGNVFEHGLPDDDRDWTLDGREVRRSGPVAAAVRQCPSCFACHRPAPSCPVCGTVYEVKSREVDSEDGELTEIQNLQRKRDVFSGVRAATSLADMHELAKKMGYKPGWAFFRWQIELKRRGSCKNHP